MAAPATPYGAFLQAVVAGQINYATDTYKLLLTTSSYTPDRDHHQYLSDITDEVVGAGYTAGGVTLTGLNETYDETTHAAIVVADAAMWAAATVSFRYGVVYKSTGVAGTSLLMGYLDFGSTQTVTNTDFGFTFPNGLLRVTPPAA